MSQSISPYALLQASKPKPVSTITTAYDLYSAVQSASSAPSSVSPASPPPMPAQDPPPVPHEHGRNAVRMPLVPAKRTHYITDIQTRHNAALRRATPRPHTPMR